MRQFSTEGHHAARRSRPREGQHAAIAARERQEQEQQNAIPGTLRSAPVDLFTQQALRWVQTRGGAWVISLGAQHGTLWLQLYGADTWQVVQVRREIQQVLLGHGLPLPYAQGFAEDFARLQGMERLVDMDVPWRQDPATEKQAALLGKLGVAIRPELTKGEAADLIAAVLGDWN